MRERRSPVVEIDLRPCQTALEGVLVPRINKALFEATVPAIALSSDGLKVLSKGRLAVRLVSSA